MISLARQAAVPIPQTAKRRCLSKEPRHEVPDAKSPHMGDSWGTNGVVLDCELKRLKREGKGRGINRRMTTTYQRSITCLGRECLSKVFRARRITIRKTESWTRMVSVVSTIFSRLVRRHRFVALREYNHSLMFCNITIGDEFVNDNSDGSRNKDGAWFIRARRRIREAFIKGRLP